MRRLLVSGFVAGVLAMSSVPRCAFSADFNLGAFDTASGVDSLTTSIDSTSGQDVFYFTVTDASPDTVESDWHFTGDVRRNVPFFFFLFDSADNQIGPETTFVPMDGATDFIPSIASLSAGTYHLQIGFPTTQGDQAYEITESILNPPSPAAPEPSTWALLFAGVGIAGFALRTRRQNAVAAA